jgi:hypothetical protein
VTGQETAYGVWKSLQEMFEKKGMTSKKRPWLH